MKKIGINGFASQRKSQVIKKLLISISIVIILAIISFFTYRNVYKSLHEKASITQLHDRWSVYDYQGVFDTSTILIEKKPLNNTVRTFRGYAAFYLAVSQTENSDSQKYINEAIKSLRIAILNAKKNTKPQIEYMLGKSYFYKNELSSYHFYSDLAIKYLMLAREHGYKASDIYEYLGLSYASIGKTMESIASFSEALLVRESDSLLLSIAEQYYKAKMLTASKQYLFQIKKNTSDDSLMLKTMTLLAQIYLDEEKYEDAQKEYESILEKNENSADAHYGLGVIYEKSNDLVKARAEWRKALRIQVNHANALKKMAEYK